MTKQLKRKPKEHLVQIAIAQKYYDYRPIKLSNLTKQIYSCSRQRANQLLLSSLVSSANLYLVFLKGSLNGKIVK